MWLLASLTACIVTKGTDTVEREPGTLELTWNVGADGCDAAGVTDVEIELGTSVERIPCSEGGATITGDPGRYDVVATGLDADGVARYEGILTVDIPEGGEAVGNVTLSALPANLEITWYFENGRLCAANSVTDLHVVLFDADDFVVQEITLPCDEGITTMSDLVSGTFGLLAEGLDEAGALTFQGTADVTLEKGDVSSVEVELLERL